ncbi:MAG TPA: hypothetical protein VHX13_05325 [Acidobacteriaceae bacterium]|nr:hypothetical protein [Acidobacteriaceae bacterium]
MSGRAIATVGNRLGWICVLFLSGPLAVSQCTSADRQDAAALADTEISHIGPAEVKSAPEWVIDSAAYRCRQPDVYWHDKNWRLDLILPSAERNQYSLSIRPAIGAERILRLDDLYDQIASISATPNNKAIVVGFAYGRLERIIQHCRHREPYGRNLDRSRHGLILFTLTESPFSHFPQWRPNNLPAL